MNSNFTQTNRRLAVLPALVAALGFVTLTIAQNNTEPAAPKPSTPPRIIATSPKIGAMNVDPTTTEISVTFDRDMGEGMSWTGGGPTFPKSPEGTKAHWVDQRTCVLPVMLRPGISYSLGINSPSYHGFCSAGGVPAVPSAFTHLAPTILP